MAISLNISSEVDIRAFLARLRSKYVRTELVRIGGNGDGGYLVPNSLERIKYCFSPGVDVTANFELELSKKYGIISFMADASVAKAPIDDDNFVFDPFFLGSQTTGNFITLSDWMDKCVGGDDSPSILQMDIEGGELEVLVCESAETLAKFDVMVIEFHWLQSMFTANFLKTFSGIFEKIYKNFSICHIHPNNCCGTQEHYGVEVPVVMEFTFVNNKLLKSLKPEEELVIPHPFDQQNVATKPDITLPEIWWRT